MEYTGPGGVTSDWASGTAIYWTQRLYDDTFTLDPNVPLH